MRLYPLITKPLVQASQRGTTLFLPEDLTYVKNGAGMYVENPPQGFNETKS
jgi:hypothetical protein